MNIISRPEYQTEIRKYFGKETIIALTGQRRVGKSYVLLELRENLSAESSNNVIFVDKEKKQWDDVRTFSDLNAHVESRFIKGKNNYILIDEVQEIDEFERSLRHWRTEQDTEVIVTGSNAETLSGELSTLLGGRCHEIYVQSLTYKDFLRFHNLADSDESLSLYINAGGLPGLVKHDVFDVDEVFKYDEDVLNTALMKDIVLKHKIRNVPFLYNLVRFLADNIGKNISATSICRYMKGTGSPVSPDLTLRYLGYLCDAYIVHKVERFELRGKKLLESNNKYYFEDVGIRNTRVGTDRDKDMEKLLESIVYQQLVHDGYTVRVGILRAGEVDFVCTRQRNKIYVQVSYLIDGENTREREFGTLKKINDNYPKYVISMSPLAGNNDDDGIIHLSLRKFLMGGI